jgi:2-dehydro-3-deoxyphosphogluconate aldolase/(4S)-4-hydroxy-2-oxoglutarate aldolase
MTPDEFLTVFKEQRASAILRTNNTDNARKAMNAAIDGGFRVIEFTFSIPGALDLIREFSQREGIIVGAGTIITPYEAAQAIEAGAKFLVAPVVGEDVIKTASEMNVAMMPGCATPTEMLHAHRLGAQLQKLFPGQATGAAWVKQTLGPLPFLNIVPTSGVTLDNAADFLKAGSFAVGFVNSLFDPEEIAGGRFDVIQERAAAMLDAVRGA